ncbi:hypothetical protein B0H12DRAFT_1097275 [Mycena haematopus]|nr:hypothetical protein B0H12DRAFT_1097275 [Mycena haematopus]
MCPCPESSSRPSTRPRPHVLSPAVIPQLCFFPLPSLAVMRYGLVFVTERARAAGLCGFSGRGGEREKGWRERGTGGVEGRRGGVEGAGGVRNGRGEGERDGEGNGEEEGASAE